MRHEGERILLEDGVENNIVMRDYNKCRANSHFSGELTPSCYIVILIPDSGLNTKKFLILYFCYHFSL